MGYQGGLEGLPFRLAESSVKAVLSTKFGGFKVELDLNEGFFKGGSPGSKKLLHVTQAQYLILKFWSDSTKSTKSWEATLSSRTT